MCVLASAVLFGPGAYAAQWMRTYGGTAFDGADAVRQTADGGYVVAGQTYSFGPARGAWLFKLDAAGNLEWQKAYGGGTYDRFRSIEATADGGYIAAGSASLGADGARGYSNALVLKLDGRGDVLWQCTFGTTLHNWFSSVRPTPDGGYIAVGEIESFAAGGWVVKFDAGGTVLWQRIYNGLFAPRAVDLAADGGYVVGGDGAALGGGRYTAWLAKIDGLGNVLWQKTYSHFGSEVGTSVRATTDGGYVLAGYTNTLGDAMVLKLDSSGEVIWQKAYVYSGREGLATGVLDVQPTPDAGYVVVGYTRGGSAWLAKLDAGGDILWQHIYGVFGPDYFSSVQSTVDGGYVMAGQTKSFRSGSPGDVDAWVLKVNSKGEIPGCAFRLDPGVVVSGALLTTGNGAGIAAAGGPVPVTTVVAPQDTAAVVQQLCYFDDGTAGIPTLSAWFLMAMSGALGFLGIAMIRRSRKARSACGFPG